MKRLADPALHTILAALVEAVVADFQRSLIMQREHLQRRLLQLAAQVPATLARVAAHAGHAAAEVLTVAG